MIPHTSQQNQEVSRETIKDNKVYFLFLYSLHKNNQTIPPAYLYTCKVEKRILSFPDRIPLYQIDWIFYI